MTYDEIIKERQELEKAIYSLIADYERKTKFHVESVDVSSIEYIGRSTGGNRAIVSHVTVSVRV